MSLTGPEDGPDFRVTVLGSGSGGNAVLVRSGRHALLLDAGFSCRELERRIRACGGDPDAVGALFLTHEHEDHVRGAERFARRHGVAVFATEGTWAGGEAGVELRERGGRIRSGEVVEVPGFRVEAFALPHDAREPVGYVVEDDRGRRLGLVSDLGCASRLAWGRLTDLDLLLLESNHDLGMLRRGPYPWVLKQRVAGRHGHLSNEQAAEGLRELAGARLRWVVGYHLSRTNNLPALAAVALGEELDRLGSRAAVLVSDQFEPTPWLEVAE
ncbi:MAG TPA: MBL fold metallo-hydrolase [Thermoanaerobaculia bacterium]|nr:MBL fold metallo-hydrolase [Thermoanaerobaculia bacterium]